MVLMDIRVWRLIVLKHVTHQIGDRAELKILEEHLFETTRRIGGVDLIDIYFPRGKNEFILMLDCIDEDRYLEWREICPPPPGADDWYEIWLSRDERFPPED
jgi:hypothetical protein